MRARARTPTGGASGMASPWVSVICDMEVSRHSGIHSGSSSLPWNRLSGECRKKERAQRLPGPLLSGNYLLVRQILPVASGPARIALLLRPEDARRRAMRPRWHGKTGQLGGICGGSEESCGRHDAVTVARARSVRNNGTFATVQRASRACASLHASRWCRGLGPTGARVNWSGAAVWTRPEL